jgi:hypothetical protein
LCNRVIQKGSRLYDSKYYIFGTTLYKCRKPRQLAGLGHSEQSAINAASFGGNRGRIGKRYDIAHDCVQFKILGRIDLCDAHRL